MSDFDDIINAIFEWVLKTAFVTLVCGAVFLIWSLVFHVIINGIK